MYKNTLILFFFYLLLVTYFHNTAYCDNRLFLHKSVNLTNEHLFLNDILSITGNSEEVNRIRNIMIPAEIYSDGYIDRKEISLLLRKHSKEIFLLYGNSVRIIDGTQQDYYSDISKYDIIVKKGDTVNLVVKKNGIFIEVMGIVLEDGKFDDEINIKLVNKSGKILKIVRGRIKSRDLVEAVL